MSTIKRTVLLFPCVLLPELVCAGEITHTAAKLVAAVRDAAEGQTIEIGPGTFELAAPLQPKPGMTLRGAGMGKTILTHVAGWKPSTKTLPDPEKDWGNLISGFGKASAKGPASFHNNLVSNPGRGVIWINEVYNNLDIHNNHIITRTTATPRRDGLFGLNRGCDFKTISIRDNIVKCQGLPRPLLRCDESYGAIIRNNVLTNVSDTDRYKNPRTNARAGLEEPLRFECGVHGEYTVDGWKVRPTAR